MAIFGWSPWSTAILLVIVLFFLLAMSNRWLPVVGVPFNQFGAYVLGIIPCLLLARYWSAKAGIVIGLILGLVGGIGGSMFFGDTGDS